MSQPFADHFSAVAHQYADYRPCYPEPLFAYLATLVPPAALVWDCACGSGQAALALARHFDRIVATDASQEQVAAGMPHPGVEYRVAPAEQSGLPAAGVGLITVAQALHWFDLERFYPEARRVLAPGGVIAVWSYGVIAVEGDAANHLLREFYSQTLGPYWPPERRVVEEGYRTLPFPFVELTPPALAMEARWTLAELLGYLGTWSATSRYRKALGRDPIAPLTAKLVRVWGEAHSARRITWPLSLRVGRK